MITETNLRLLKLQLNFLYKSHAFPFYWDEDHSCYFRDDSRVKFVCLYITSAFIHACFVMRYMEHCTSNVANYNCSSLDLSLAFLNLLMFSAMVMFFTFYSLVIQPGEMAQIHNAFELFVRSLRTTKISSRKNSTSQNPSSDWTTCAFPLWLCCCLASS